MWWPAVLPLEQLAVIPPCRMKCRHPLNFFHNPWKKRSTMHIRKMNSVFYSQLPLERHLWKEISGGHQRLFLTVHLKQTQVQWDYRNWLECLNAFAMPYISSCFVMLYGQETRFRLWQQDRQSHLYRNIVVRHHHALVSWIPQNVHQDFLLKFSFFPAAIIVLSTVAQNVLCILCEK